MSRSFIATNYPRAQYMPTDWALGRLKNLLRRKITDGPHSTPVFLAEGVPFLSVDGIKDGELCFKKCRYISPEDYAEFRKKADPEKGDILLGKAASTGKVAIVRTTRTFSIWSPLALIKLDKLKACPDYVWYSMGAKFFQAEIDDYCTSNTQKNISMDDIPRLPLFIPPLSEQRQIAAYLNRETAKIDKLIAKQQMLIKLLQEKRQAVISQAVTKGLDPNVKMKDSGVEWLGQVPEHWTQLSIRHMTQILRGKFTHRPRNDPAFYDGDFPFIQTGDITKADKYITSYKQTLNEKGAAVSRQFPSGTLVMAIAANIGDVGIINFSAYFPDSIVGLVPRDRTNIDFLFYLMQALKPSLIQNATVSTQMNLNADQIARIAVVCPPLHEQIEIVKFVEANLNLFNRLSDKAQNAQNLLQEHRQALITAAVTGKIDVRGLVTDEEVAALDAEPEVETTEEDLTSEVLEDTYITEEE